MIKIIAPYLLSKHTKAMSLFCFIILRDEEALNDKVTINHETIHWRQQVETLFIGFYLLYVFYYLKRRLDDYPHELAYQLIPFEIEAYMHQNDLDYLSTRKLYAWL